MSENYEAPLGSNLPGAPSPSSNATFGYADKDRLNLSLNQLIRDADALQFELEETLKNFALPVEADDAKLIQAHESEWPKALGDIQNQVTYRYYKTLRLKDTTSASYIRKRFEEAARDVAGTSALDLYKIVELTKTEAMLIQEFINRYVGRVNDSSEKRILETFQDWVQPALIHTSEVRAYARKKPEESSPFTPEELSVLTNKEAREGQAVSKLKLNSNNSRIAKNLDYLERNFTRFAPVFYHRFLGPALEFRLSVSAKRPAMAQETEYNKNLFIASTQMDQNLESVLADQARRRMMYQSKMTELKSLVASRDTHRQSIKALSAKGKPIPQSGRRAMVKANYLPEHVDFFDNMPEPDPIEVEPTTPNMVSSHGDLSGLEEDHHPQYLLRAGGHLTGNITTDSGVKIDGVDVSAHRHTGQDGSPQIHGKDIIGGTIDEDVIDEDGKPEPPENFALESYTETVSPGGVIQMEAKVSWDGRDGDTFEVQVTRV